jgi:hypothetical protein
MTWQEPVIISGNAVLMYHYYKEQYEKYRYDINGWLREGLGLL